ncbi:MAG: class I SAM-dependent methyltransferase [Chloroflexi bacterium]|nr:class I SAM-dependent methyltransferase [Chloroflexota bacterium]
MTDQAFGSLYSDCYDAFYATKDYEAECDLLEAAFRRFGNGPVETVLDLGCGTGGHALPLSRCGYRVTGVDRSAGMLEKAREKAGPAGPEFLEGDLRSLDLGRTFDAAVMMFAVLGYQVENQDVLAALRTVSRHLKPGGLFACDVWYGPAVLRDPPGERARTFRDGNREVIRVVRGGLDVARHVATVGYELWSVEPARGVEKASEAHSMRFFFPKELELFLDCAGLRLSSLTAFGDLDRSPAETDWNVFAVGVKA